MMHIFNYRMLGINLRFPSRTSVGQMALKKDQWYGSFEGKSVSRYEKDCPRKNRRRIFKGSAIAQRRRRTVVQQFIQKIHGEYVVETAQGSFTKE